MGLAIATAIQECGLWQTDFIPATPFGWLTFGCCSQMNSRYTALELSKTLFMPFELILCRAILFEMYLRELFARFCVCHEVNISSDVICRDISQFALLLPAKCWNSTTEWAYLMCARAVLNLCSSITACSREDTLTGTHAWEWDQILFFSNKQGTECTEDCFTVKRRWVGHLQSLPSWHRFKVDSVEVCGWMWVCVPVAFCQWTWLLRLPCTLHIYPILKFVPAFFNLIKVWPIWIPLAGYKLKPLRMSCLCALVHLRLTTWEWRQAAGSPWKPPLTSPGTTKSHFLRTWAAEMPPCSWWPLISFLLFIFRLWCNVVYVGGAAL